MGVGVGADGVEHGAVETCSHVEKRDTASVLSVDRTPTTPTNFSCSMDKGHNSCMAVQKSIYLFHVICGQQSSEEDVQLFDPALYRTTVTFVHEIIIM